MRELDRSIQTGLAGESDDVFNNNDIDVHVLPDQFKTVQGKTVKLLGTQHSRSFALVSYSTSKIQGNALLNEAIENPIALLSEVDLMYDEDFLEDDTGNENDSIILPIDTFELSDNLRGVITDCDLRGYENGFPFLFGFMHISDCCQNVSKISSTHLSQTLHTMIKFIKTIRHLISKGCNFKIFDGHQLFFNAEYGAFRFVYDGADMCRDNISSEEFDMLEKNISAVVIYMLTGWWPHYAYSNDFLNFPQKNHEPSPDDYEYPNDPEHDAYYNFKLLPVEIKDMIMKSVSNSANDVVSLEQWETVLQNAAKKIDRCWCCGFDVFSFDKECWHCQNSTNKAALMTKWEINTGYSPQKMRISFGRGALIPGEFFGFSDKFTPYMKVMYNSQTNLLGIKNLSGIQWYITKTDMTEELLPGRIVSVDREMTIEFEGYPKIMMRFLGYEC